MNNFIVEARVSFPPEVKTSKNGENYVVFKVAHSTKNRLDGWDTTYVKCSAFKYNAAKAEGLQKGDRVLVSGPIKLAEWLDAHGKTRSSLDMVVNDIVLVKPRTDAAAAPVLELKDEELPF